MESVPGKPHPLEAAVSRQLDSIDLDESDDWGFQEARATNAEGGVSTATFVAVQPIGGNGGERERHGVVNGEFVPIVGAPP